MKSDSLRRAALAGTFCLPALACGGDKDRNPFDATSDATSVTTASATDSTSATASASASAGTDSASSDSESATASDSASAGSTGNASASSTGGVLFDVGDSSDATGNPTDTGTPGEGCQFLDILFVVDISGSMKEEKDNLNANFPTFIQVLDDYVADPNNGALGYRIGATNSSFQSDGSTTGLDGSLFGGNNNCGTTTDPWLDGPAPNITNDFVCLATNPKACTNSCSDLGTERPLDAMESFAEKHAAGQPNEGFYRGDDSLLVIVTLTDEDDHSEPTPPAQVKAALDTFAKGEERYVIVTVAGPQAGGCMSVFGDATAAPRLHDFTNMVPNSVLGDICEGDLTNALSEALATIQTSCDMLPPPEG